MSQRLTAVCRLVRFGGGGGVTDEIRVGEVNKQAVSYSNIGETLQERVCSIVHWEPALLAGS